MRVLIDMQGAQTASRFRGIGRYSLSLTQAMARHAGGHEIWLLLNARLSESIPFLRESFREWVPEHRVRIFDAPVDSHFDSWNSLAAELIREDFISELGPDVVLLTSVVEAPWDLGVTSLGQRPARHKTAAILYDLIPLLNQEQYLGTAEMRGYYLRKLSWLKGADMLLSISDSSRREGLAHLGLAPDRLVNVSAATDPNFAPGPITPEAEQQLRSRLGIQRRMVLYVPGGYDPRKNFERLIKAYSLLAPGLRSTHQLVIAVRLADHHRQELLALRDSHGLELDELVLPGYLADPELKVLYALAELFVFPSLHEGFGLPVLEAMACGAPVIGSNCTSVPEVIGWDQALFDPVSAEDMAEKMTQALSDPTLRSQLLVHGRDQCQRFSWDESARLAIAALERLHTAPGQTETDTAEPDLIAHLAHLAEQNVPSEQGLRHAAQCIAYNRRGPRAQLLIDISEFARGDAKSGIQRVVRSVLIECLGQPLAHHNVRLIRFDRGAYRYADDVAIAVCPGAHPPPDEFGAPVDFYQDDVYLGLDLIMHLTDQVHLHHQAMAARGVRMYYIVYDLLPVDHPHWWRADVAPMFNAWLKSIGEVASGLVCISRAVASELEQWLQRHPSQRAQQGPAISSFHLGADVSGSLPSQGMPAQALTTLASIRSRTSFLMVGTLEPRKGHAQTLAAFELIWATGADIPLVIVGKRGWLVDALVQRLQEHPENGRRLFWLEGISDEFLEGVYAACSCLIAASEGEGFGLPLIEAAQHNLPILARDLPVFREVAGEHAEYFSGLQAADLQRAVTAWTEKHQAGLHTRSANMPWLTWKESTQQLLEIILKAELA